MLIAGAVSCDPKLLIDLRVSLPGRGGRRQRIAIARALAVESKLVVCDEPVSALDLTTRRTVLDLPLEIQERTGVSYLFISHGLAVVRFVSHRVAVMHRGGIVGTGDAVTVTTSPERPSTRGLLPAAPVADVAASAPGGRRSSECYVKASSGA